MIHKLENPSFGAWSKLSFDPFTRTPNVDKKDVEKGIQIQLVGWLKDAPSSSIGIIITTEKGMQQDTKISSDGSCLDTETSLGHSTDAETYYYVASIGVGARLADWEIEFEIKDSKEVGNTGTWVFSKAKETEDLSL